MTGARTIEGILTPNDVYWMENVALHILAIWTEPFTCCCEYFFVRPMHASYMNQLRATYMTNHCCFRMRLGSCDGLIGIMMEEDICSIYRFLTCVAIIKDIVLPPLNDYFFLSFAFWILITQLFDRSFALRACVFYLIDPLIDAIVAVLMSATIE